MYHIGCAFTLHHKFRIDTGRQILRFVDPMNKEHKDPDEINLNAPRLAWHKQENGRNIKTRCIGSTSKLLNRKDLSSMKHDRTQSSFTTLQAYCIPKPIMMETGEILYEKMYASPRLPPKIFSKDNWMKELVKTPNKPNGKPRIQFSSTLVWLRKHKLKNGETCKELCASVC